MNAYPRLAHYTMNRGTGAPLLNPDGSLNSPVIANLARHHVIAPDITPWYSPETMGRVAVLQALRRANPRLRILAYQLFAWWYLPLAAQRTGPSWADSWHRALVETNGLLDNQWVRWDNPATEKRLTELLCNLAASRLFDGVFWDYFDAFKVTSSGAWNQAVDRCVHAVREAGGPGFMICGNGGDLRNTHGSMREGFPADLWTSSPDNVRLWRSGRPHKSHDWLQAGTGHSDPTNPETQRASRYAHGYACLFDMLCSFGPDRDQSIPYHTWWFDHYDGGGRLGTGWLGEPMGPAEDWTETGGIWRRFFGGGAVYVNVGTSARTIVLPKGLCRFDGTEMGSVTVQPKDAYFLVRAR